MFDRNHPLQEAQSQQLDRLVSEHRIRAQVNRYMRLCDELAPDTALDELLSLFTADAIWEGRGERFQAAFGRLCGRAEIGNMFRRYTTSPPHFAFNAHFLCSELIELDESCRSARASWMMLQPSTLATGESRLSAARLRLTLTRNGDVWLIAHFQTENLFSRGVDRWDEHSQFQVPRDEK